MNSMLSKPLYPINKTCVHYQTTSFKTISFQLKVEVAEHNVCSLRTMTHSVSSSNGCMKKAFEDLNKKNDVLVQRLYFIVCGSWNERPKSSYFLDQVNDIVAFIDCTSTNFINFSKTVSLHKLAKQYLIPR